ncbi:MAG: peptide deformylase [Coriobacteriia bacterium]|nr:peptide deformylase [Coriobacteriia bacterium]
MSQTLKVVLSPDPVLRTDTEEVVEFDDALVKLAEDMTRTMYASNGVGIAAPQVGVLKRLIIVETNYGEDEEIAPLALVNPVIIDHSEDTMIGYEGCLSIPGVSFEIERYKDVVVSYQDLRGDYHEISASGDILSRCLQHEIDHTHGLTMFERLPASQRISALSQYNEALNRGAKPGDVE